MAGRGILGRLRGRVDGRRGAVLTPGADAGDGGSPRGGTARPFDHRVRVLVELRDDPDELQLAEEVVGACGWPMREPRPGEVPAEGIRPSYVARVVEVRLLGTRRGAAAQAAWELELLARRTGLDLLPRDATLIRRTLTPGKGWGVVPIRVSLRDRGRALLELDQEDRPERFLYVPEVLSTSTPDIASLSRPTGAQQLDAAEYALKTYKPRSLMPPLLLTGLTIAAVAGFAALINLVGVPPEGPDDILIVCMAIALALSYMIGGWGIRHAVLYSATVRLALPWTVPLALPVLLAGVPRIGDVVQNKYLSSFYLPDHTATSDWQDSLGAGVFPTLWALGGFLLIMGIAALVHRAYARAGAPFGPILALGSLCAFTAGLVLAAVAVGRADAVAADDQRALASGQVPDDFFGLRPDFVCVRPTTKSPPVYGPIPPSTRPVVTFGPQGDRIALWDPKTGQALSMRLEDASFVPAVFDHGRAGCPQAR
jgi:hypothetical protein